MENRERKPGLTMVVQDERMGDASSPSDGCMQYVRNESCR
jgi:hypothetical protein